MALMEVDGERFEVMERFNEPGINDIRWWWSGPRAGYGFATSSYLGEHQSEPELQDAIRNCLSRVGPSGYIE